MANEILPADGFSAAAQWSEQSRRAAAERARRYENSAFSENTQDVYDRAWTRFVKWAAKEKIDPLPVPTPLELISAYLTYLADENLKLPSINLAAAAIASFHEISKCPIDLDALAKLRRGIRNQVGVAPQRQASPVYLRDLAKMIETCGPDIMGVRDRAVLLVGYFAALRRSEIAALKLSDIELSESGVKIKIRRSKTDQPGKGEAIFLERSPSSPFCAPSAIEAWIREGDITGGALFRNINRWGHCGYDALSPGSIRLIVRRRAGNAGFDKKKFSGHSLRAGFATNAFQLDVALADVSKRLRHKNPKTTMFYDRRTSEKDAEKFRVLLSEFANDPAPAKPLKADAPKAALLDDELRAAMDELDAKRARVDELLRQREAAKIGEGS